MSSVEGSFTVLCVGSTAFKAPFLDVLLTKSIEGELSAVRNEETISIMYRTSCLILTTELNSAHESETCRDDSYRYKAMSADVVEVVLTSPFCFAGVLIAGRRVMARVEGARWVIANIYSRLALLGCGCLIMVPAFRERVARGLPNYVYGF